MNQTQGRGANRCLPLLVANQAGWVLLNPDGFEAVWDGRQHPDGIALTWDDPKLPEPRLASSHFGSGVLTFTVPYLFRTPPDWNLLARGPANWPIDGACALEGLIETDWSVATFTMNWKLTRPDLPVRFDQGLPFCMVVPQRRGELESFTAAIQPLKRDLELYEQTKLWAQGRHETQVRKFLAEYAKDFAEDWSSWEKDYFKGRLPDGSPAPDHQTTLRLKAFNGQRLDPTEPQPDSESSAASSSPK